MEARQEEMAGPPPGLNDVGAAPLSRSAGVGGRDEGGGAVSKPRCHTSVADQRAVRNGARSYDVPRAVMDQPCR